MIVNIIVTTPNGFFADANYEAPLLTTALAQVVSQLEKIPEEVDGVSWAEWSAITITISRG